MSYTFICTNEKEWYLKISTVEQLLEYWDSVFNKRLKDAFDGIMETKEFGRGMRHCDEIQAAIGFMSRGERISYKEAYEKILFDTRLAQYKEIDKGNTVYVNRKLGWNSDNKETEQFIHKKEFEFPVMKKDRLKIEKFPLGNHFYVFIDGVQIRQGENLKFNTYKEAEQFASKYIK